MRAQKKKTAFTLLEVVVAMALFSLAVGMLAQAANNALRATMIADETRSRTLDMFYIRENILAVSDRDEMETGGEIETPESGRVQWRGYVYPATAADLFFLILVIDFPATDVLPAETLTQTLYVNRPSWSDSAERAQLVEDFTEYLDLYRPERAEDTGEGKVSL